MRQMNGIAATISTSVVRRNHDDAHHDPQVQPQRNQRPPVVQAVKDACQMGGKGTDKNDLSDFCGLDADGAEAQPAVVAALRVAEGRVQRQL